MKIDIILEPDVTPAQITELGLQAEGHGINRIWVQNYSAARDCFMSLVPLALASKRIAPASVSARCTLRLSTT